MAFDERTDEKSANVEPEAATRPNSLAQDSRDRAAAGDSTPSRSESHDSRSLVRLERRMALYERTLGLAVLPVLFRRLAITLARKISRGSDRTRLREAATSARDSRLWVEAGPREIGRFNMFIDPTSAGHGANQMALGIYDETFIDALRPHASLEGAVVWDVGAHIGYQSLYFATLVGPAGQVVAFEPNPANVREWQRNVEGNPGLASRLSVQTIALCDRSGTAAFRYSEDVTDGRSTGSHLADVMPPEGQVSYATFGLLNVACARVDELVEAGEIAPPGLIKIDVEGAEADVVRGALRTLRNFGPVLLVEVHHVRAMHDLDAILQEAGYEASVLDSPEESASRCFLKAVPSARASS